MSDNDLIRRSWLLAEYDRQHEGPAGKARKLIEDAPVEHPEVDITTAKYALPRIDFEEKSEE